MNENIPNIHVHNIPLGERRNQHYRLYAWHGTESSLWHEYYGLAWGTNADHAKDIAAAGHFQIDPSSIVAWEWLTEYGTPGWGIVGFDQAQEVPA